MRSLLQRAGLVIAIAAGAILCLSSARLAAIVGVLTAAVVAVDMRVLAPRGSARREPDKLSVDLTRRR